MGGSYVFIRSHRVGARAHRPVRALDVLVFDDCLYCFARAISSLVRITFLQQCSAGATFTFVLTRFMAAHLEPPVEWHRQSSGVASTVLASLLLLLL